MSGAVITEEQLRSFYDRAEKAEKLAQALQNQINVLKSQGGKYTIYTLYIIHYTLYIY